jgi:glycosyltransferase involved in cell wall biosynthesis
MVVSFWVSLIWFLIRRRASYDVIHSHGNLQHGVVALVGKWLKKPTILKIAMANSDIAFHKHGRLWGALNRFFVARYDCYIATSQQIEDEIFERGLDTRRVRRIPNGVDTTEYRPSVSEPDRESLRRKLGLPQAPILISVGIINARKNIRFILEVFGRVVRTRPDARLVLLGPIPDHADNYWRELQGFVVEHGLQNQAMFLGMRKNVSSYLRASNIFIFPSVAEGMPNALLEAMACGLACVASRTSGTEDLIEHGTNGFLFGLGDSLPFTSSVLQLLNGQASASMVGAMARNTIVSKYSIEATADRYVALYSSLLGNR